MSEALRLAPLANESPSETILAELHAHPAEDNDNDTAPARQSGEQRLFELPARLWWAMLACYVVFLAGMFATAGGGYATLVLVIAAGFVAMFFGTTKVMLRHGPAQPRSPLDSAARRLSTLDGPMRESQVAVQMLIVPACVAFFGIAVLVISAAVF